MRADAHPVAKLRWNTARNRNPTDDKRTWEDHLSAVLFGLLRKIYLGVVPFASVPRALPYRCHRIDSGELYFDHRIPVPGSSAQRRRTLIIGQGAGDQVAGLQLWGKAQTTLSHFASSVPQQATWHRQGARI